MLGFLEVAALGPSVFRRHQDTRHQSGPLSDASSEYSHMVLAFS